MVPHINMGLLWNKVNLDAHHLHCDLTVVCWS